MGALERLVGRATLWLPLVTFGVYLATATWTHPVFIDSHAAALEGWVLARNGQPWLDGVDPSLLATAEGPFPNWLFLDTGAHAVSSRTIGVVLAATPFAVLAPTFVLWPSTLAAVLLATAAVTFMHRALLRLVGPAVALATALVFAFATPTWSVTANSLVTHGLTQAAIAGAAWAAACGRWWWAGTAMAVGITGRVHLAVVAAALGLGVAVAQRRPRIALAVGLPAALGLAVVVATNVWRYGVVNLSGGYASYAEENLTATGADAWLGYLVNWAGYLVSPDRGLLLWTPALIVLVVPAVRALRTAPAWVVSLAAGGLLYTIVQLRINAFSGGDTFYGYRLALELVTCLVPLAALAVLQVRTAATRAVLVVLCWVQFALIAPGAIMWGLFASQDDVWRLSSFVLALAWQPGVTIAGLAVAAVGATITLVLLGRPTASAPSAEGFAGSPGTSTPAQRPG